MAGNKRVGQNNGVRSPEKEIDRAMLCRVTGAEGVREDRAGAPDEWESLCVAECPWGEGGRGPVLAQLWMKFPMSFTLWTQGGSQLHKLNHPLDPHGRICCAQEMWDSLLTVQVESVSSQGLPASADLGNSLPIDPLRP